MWCGMLLPILTKTYRLRIERVGFLFERPHIFRAPWTVRYPGEAKRDGRTP